MVMLPNAALDAARDLILSQARPLEQALYRHWFLGESHDPALSELAHFQNPDGGFGRALEPDLRTPESSALATTVALQTLRDLQVGASHALVRGAIRYLVSTMDPETLAWPSVPLSVNDHPHAPWWERDPAGPAVTEGEMDNPRPEVLGYFHEHATLVPPGLLSDLTEAVLARLRGIGSEIEMHAFLCYLRLAETPGLQSALRDELLAKLRGLLDGVVARPPAQWAGYFLAGYGGPHRAFTVARPPAQWAGYSLRPLDVASSPRSLFAEELRDAVELQLGHEVKRLAGDGAVRPAWGWSDAYPDAWEDAAREWTGWMTLGVLRALQAYGRLG